MKAAPALQAVNSPTKSSKAKVLMTLCNNPKHLVEGVEVPVLYMIKLSGAIFNLNVFLREMPVRGKKKPINFLYYFFILFFNHVFIIYRTPLV
jgi:hypothetical protein